MKSDLKKQYQGSDVYKILKKLGNENHDDDPLDYEKRSIESNSYIVVDIPISKILQSDVDAKFFIKDEMTNFKDDYTKRTVKSPILIDKNFHLVDGYHRLAQTIFNGKKKIQSFVPIKK